MTVGEVEERKLSGRSRAFLPARLSFHDSGAVERTQYPSANMEEFMTGTSHKGASQMLRLDWERSCCPSLFTACGPDQSPGEK